MAARRRKRSKKAIIKQRLLSIFCILSITAVVVLLGYVAITVLPNKSEGSVQNNGNSAQSSVIKPVKEPEFKETTASVLSTGDIMVHSTQLDGAYVPATNSYDFSAFFKYVSPVFKKFDLNVANLEVTFGGTEAGNFSGYPAFNTPDSLADVIKESGLNLLITSNNHSYDTGLSGLKRTAKILTTKKIEFTGTKENANDPSFIVKEVNNIHIGIANFTYETSPENPTAGRKYLNGNAISTEANELINTFSYKRIDEFYSQAQSIIDSMKNDGAEFIVFYMHWGNEYQTTPNTYQKSIAQKLSNMGVNIIVGSHPHVVQPIELITSEDGENSTVCLYSTGNAISNQRQEVMDSCPSGHTEDGVLFTFTLRKTKDGVILDDLDLIPTWVNKYRGGSGYQYSIYPLPTKEDAQKYGFNSSELSKAQRSFDRTKEIVAPGLTECQKFIGCETTFE